MFIFIHVKSNQSRIYFAEHHRQKATIRSNNLQQHYDHQSRETTSRYPTNYDHNWQQSRLFIPIDATMRANSFPEQYNISRHHGSLGTINNNNNSSSAHMQPVNWNWSTPYRNGPRMSVAASAESRRSVLNSAAYRESASFSSVYPPPRAGYQSREMLPLVGLTSKTLSYQGLSRPNTQKVSYLYKAETPEIVTNLSTRSPTEGQSSTTEPSCEFHSGSDTMLMNKPKVCRSPTEITGFPNSNTQYTEMAKSVKASKPQVHDTELQSNNQKVTSSLLYDKSLTPDYGSFKRKDFSSDSFQKSFLDIVSPTPSGGSLTQSGVSTTDSTASKVEGFNNRNYQNKSGYNSKKCLDLNIAGADWPYLAPQFDDLYGSNCDLRLTMQRPSPEGSGGSLSDVPLPSVQYTADYYTLTYTDADLHSDISNNTAESQATFNNGRNQTDSKLLTADGNQRDHKSVPGGRQTSIESTKSGQSSDYDAHGDTAALLPKHKVSKTGRWKNTTGKTHEQECLISPENVPQHSTENDQNLCSNLAIDENPNGHKSAFETVKPPGTLLTSMKSAIKFHQLEIKKEDIVEAEKKNKIYSLNLGEGLCVESSASSDMKQETAKPDSNVCSNTSTEIKEDVHHIKDDGSSVASIKPAQKKDKPSDDGNNVSPTDKGEITGDSDGYIYDEDIKDIGYNKPPTVEEGTTSKYSTGQVYSSIINNKNKLIENIKASSIMSHMLGQKEKVAEYTSGLLGKKDKVPDNVRNQTITVAQVHALSIEEKQDIEKGEKDINVNEKKPCAKDLDEIKQETFEDDDQEVSSQDRLKEEKAAKDAEAAKLQARIETEGTYSCYDQKPREDNIIDHITAEISENELDKLNPPTKSESSSTTHSKTKAVQKVVYYQNRFIAVPADPKTLRAASLSREKLRSSSVSVDSKRVHSQNADDTLLPKGSAKLANFRKCKSLDQPDNRIDTSITMQGDNLTRTSSKADIMINRIREVLQDRRDSSLENENKGSKTLSNNVTQAGSPILKKILNVVFIATGVVLFLGVLTAILYSFF